MMSKLKIFFLNDNNKKQGSLIVGLKNYLRGNPTNFKNYTIINTLSSTTALSEENDDPSSSLVVIIDADYAHECTATIVYRLNSIFRGKLSETKFHLICLLEEDKTQLKDLISEDDTIYTNPDIAQSLLLLEYMEMQSALTISNIYSQDFFDKLSGLFEKLSSKYPSRVCALEGFFKLAQCFEHIENSTPGFFSKNPGMGAMERLCGAHKNIRLGKPELGGHDARGQFDRHFSIHSSESKREGNEIGSINLIAEDAEKMFKTFLIRDFVENIRQNTWNKIGKKEIDILIIDDNPGTFKNDLEQLLKCWPKGKIKFTITIGYKTFVKISENNTLLLESEAITVYRIPASDKKKEFLFIDYFKDKNPNTHHFIFVDLLLGKKNKGLEVVRNLIRLRNTNHRLQYDIFLFSRSTNTNDIQMALNEGACGYLFKNRIFSIPHRISELLLQKGEKEHDDLDYIAPFSMLTKLPLKEIRKLKTTEFKPDKINNEFIRNIPKADLHCHIGGSMDAKITLELAANILREMLMSYAYADVFSGCNLKLNQKEDVELNIEESKRLEGNLNRLFENSEGYEDKQFVKLLLLIKNLSKHIKSEIEKNNTPDVKSQIIEITNAISGIKKYQLICFILFRLAFEYKQNFITTPDTFLFVQSKLQSKNSLSFKEYIREIIKAKELTLDTINPNLEKLIVAPKTDFIENKGMGLSKYLKGSLFTGSVVLQTEENIKKVVDYICEKSIKDEVWYREIKVTPEGNTKGGLSESDVIGIYKKAFNESSEKKDGFPIINLIIAGKRHGEIKALDRNIRLVFRDTAKNSVGNIESDKNNENSTRTRICGFDLVGEEIFYDPKNFRDSFKRLFETCIPLTIHAGEETDAGKIWQAVYELNADRIGHGLSLGDSDENSKKLLKRFSDHKVCIELCPKSNYLTKGFKYCVGNEPNGSEKAYPLRQFIKNKLQITINTDDPGFSGQYTRSENDTIGNDTIQKDQNFDYWLSEEYLLATELFKSSFPEGSEGSKSSKKARYLSQWEVLKIVKMGFKHAFLDVTTKKDLIRKVDEKIYDVIMQNKKVSYSSSEL